MQHVTQEMMNQWLTDIDAQITQYQEELEDTEFKQGHYGQLATLFAAQGRVQYLRRDASIFYETSYQQAVKFMEKNFMMAYDVNAPDYIGDSDEMHWEWVDENAGIDMLIWALMGGEYDRLLQISQRIEIPSNHIGYDEEYDACMHDAGWLLETMREQFCQHPQEALNAAEQIFKQYQAPPLVSSHPYRHYYYLAKAVIGIIEQDKSAVEDNLLLQCQYHRKYAETKTPKDNTCYMCEDAIAITKLANYRHINVVMPKLNVD